MQNPPLLAKKAKNVLLQQEKYGSGSSADRQGSINQSADGSNKSSSFSLSLVSLLFAGIIKNRKCDPEIMILTVVFCGFFKYLSDVFGT